MNITKYRLLRRDRAASPVPDGVEFVYDCKGYDYGCSRDDTIIKGFPHISVTLAEDGAYPFFTIPEADLEPVELLAV